MIGAAGVIGAAGAIGATTSVRGADRASGPAPTGDGALTQASVDVAAGSRRTDLRLVPAAAAAWGGCGWAVAVRPESAFRLALGCAALAGCLLLLRLAV